MVLPGDRLPRGVPGAGTYLDTQGDIRASIFGQVQEGETVSVNGLTPQLPRVQDMIYGRVTKLSKQQAHVDILAIEERALEHSFFGVIRMHDVRKHEIDRLKIDQCFLPGDIIKARVISLGDSKSFFLSTAENELGVLVAQTETGQRLQPYDWENMVCVETGELVRRKVAKPV